MSKFAKVCLGIAAVIAGVGIILCCVGAAFGATLVGVENKAGATSFGNFIGHFADFDGWNWDWSWNSDDYKENDSTVTNDAYSYDMSQVKNLDISVRAASLSIDKSSSDKVEVKVLRKNGEVTSKIDGDTLSIQENKNHFARVNKVKIQVLLPKGMQFKNVNIDVDAGELKSSYGELSAESATLNVDAGDANIENLKVENALNAKVGAGSIEVKDLQAKDMDLNCGVGQISVKGKISGQVSGDCGIGEISMKLDGKEDAYNYDLDCGIGKIDIDSDTYSSLGREKHIDNGAKNDMTLHCGIGKITVKYN
jgi:hypothetical protein